MRRFLLALLMTTVVASLQAITINWQVANSEYTWDNAGVSTYLVYSQTDGLTAAEVYNGNGTDYNGYKVSPGATAGAPGSITSIGTPTAPVAELNSYMTLGFGSDGKKANVIVDLEGTAFGDGYFYLVVFKTGTETTDDPQYAVSQAVKYTANESNATNGIYDIDVDGATPDMGQFIEIPWLGGTWRDAVVPEPTALALLALGVAGLALRRKI